MEKEACAWTHMPHGIEQWMQKNHALHYTFQCEIMTMSVLDHFL
jgi:hypothetical protein